MFRIADLCLAKKLRYLCIVLWVMISCHTTYGETANLHRQASRQLMPVFESYISYSCPACATFKTDILGYLKRRYRDKMDYAEKIIAVCLQDLIAYKIVRAAEVSGLQVNADMLFSDRSWIYGGDVIAVQNSIYSIFNLSAKQIEMIDRVLKDKGQGFVRELFRNMKEAAFEGVRSAPVVRLGGYYVRGAITEDIVGMIETVLQQKE